MIILVLYKLMLYFQTASSFLIYYLILCVLSFASQHSICAILPGANMVLGVLWTNTHGLSFTSKYTSDQADRRLLPKPVHPLITALPSGN